MRRPHRCLSCGFRHGHIGERLIRSAIGRASVVALHDNILPCLGAVLLRLIGFAICRDSIVRVGGFAGAISRGLRISAVGLKDVMPLVDEDLGSLSELELIVSGDFVVREDVYVAHDFADL